MSSCKKGLLGARKNELPGCQIVVGTGVNPKELGVALDLGASVRVHAISMSQDLLEYFSHLKVVHVPLIVKDVTTSESGPVEVIDQDALVERQALEPVGIKLNNCRFTDPL